jgi:hypothetical protein
MFYTLFTDHPATLGESYFRHQRAAFSYAATLLAASLAAFVHGLIPCLFETTASRTVARLQASMAARARLGS